MSTANSLQSRTTFSRRISVRNGVIEIFTHHDFCLEGAQRAWMSSSISGLTKARFSNDKSLVSVTFESNSKLQQIEESAFQGSGLTAIHVPASVEVLC
jgi:type II restriction/modification system DNA methylase subunit YeeA